MRRRRRGLQARRTACHERELKAKTASMHIELNRDSGEIVKVFRRVFAENARQYVWHYVFAILCLFAVAGTTAISAYIMRDVVDEIFYRQRADLIIAICGVIVVAFLVRGLATY